jgi:hypothetical protein
MLGAESSSIPIALLVLGGMSILAGAVGYLSRRRELERRGSDLDDAEITLRRLELDVEVLRLGISRDVSDEIKSKLAVVAELDAKIAEAQSILGLTREELRAVRSLVADEVRRESRRSAWINVAVSAISLVAGYVLGNVWPG